MGGKGVRVVVTVFLVVLVHVAAAEIAARAFWRGAYGVPFAHPDRILYAYYPELRDVDEARPSRDDKFYDVLLLGGSVLNRDWGAIEPDLRERLGRRLRREVRVFNLAVRGHTSRDSRLKYEALGAARFELVVCYDGINDTRANNAPPAVFRPDYAHMPWYALVNALAPYHGAARFALPYTARWLGIRVRSLTVTDRSVSPGLPRPDWLAYGKDARGVASFEANLRAILEQAGGRGDRVALMTFATYVPADYSPEAFAARRLDYGLHLSPLEIWGRREDVLAALALQNDVVRRLAAEQGGVVFVDEARLMTGGARIFNDACHLTVRGSAEFVDHLMDALEPTLAAPGLTTARGAP
jgi:hypothetical protein